MGFISSLIYILFAFLTKKKLVKNSKDVVLTYGSQIKSIQETFGSIRDIILNDSHRTYLDIHKNNDLRFRYAISQSKFLGSSPRFIFETIGLVLIAFLGYFLTKIDNNSTEIIEILGITALGANKLLPMMQQVFASWAGISSTKEDLRKVLNNIDLKLNTTRSNTKKRVIKLFRKNKI